MDSRDLHGNRFLVRNKDGLLFCQKEAGKANMYWHKRLETRLHPFIPV
jgi:hypothetical protein